MYPFLLTLICLFGLTACKNDISQEKISSVGVLSSHSEEQEKEILNTVVKELFSGPDESLAAFLEKNSTVFGEGMSSISSSKESEELSVVKEKFGNHYTDEALEIFVSNYLALYQFLTKRSHATLKSKEIEIVKTSSGYDFSAAVQYEDNQGTHDVTVKGDAQFLEEGKLVSFQIQSDGGFFDLLHNNLNKIEEF
ncbi:MAG TPA: hypothetical protein GXX74_05285 [Clostridiales bacterium]|nr:hypothetical protein [Clostridiales bacterium]